MANSTQTLDRTETAMGIDIGDRNCQLAVLDTATGEVLEEGKLATTKRAFRRRFEGAPGLRIALEAGTHSAWISSLLEELGHEAIVANPRQLRLVTHSDRKSDRADALMLARLAARAPELLNPIQHRTAEAQRDLEVIRARDVLVRSRTALVNHVRTAVKANGDRLPKGSTRSFHKGIAKQIPEVLQGALQPLVDMIEQLTAKIGVFNKQVEELATTRYPATTNLRQVAGVGPLTSLAFVLTLQDPQRFPTSRAVGSFLGLRPRQRESGQRAPELRITKRGDSYLRKLLVGSAQYILGPFGPDTDLRRWGKKLGERGGKKAKRKAVVAVARKLSVLLHRLWVTGDVYEPLRNAAPSNKKELN